VKIFPQSLLLGSLEMKKKAHDSFFSLMLLIAVPHYSSKGSHSLHPGIIFPTKKKSFPSESLHCLLIVLQRKA